jgi:hypothetical protein
MYWPRQILGPAASARAAQEVRRTDQEWSLPDDEIEEIDDRASTRAGAARTPGERGVN